MMFVILWNMVNCSVMLKAKFGIMQIASIQKKSAADPRLHELDVKSECFIEAENKGTFTTAKSVVKTHVCIFFEFPTIAYAGTGK